MQIYVFTSYFIFATHFIFVTLFNFVTHFILVTPSRMQPLGDHSVDALCVLAKHLGIGYCAKIFKAKEIDGEELMFTPESEFFSMLRKEGCMCVGRLSVGGLTADTSYIFIKDSQLFEETHTKKMIQWRDIN